jgi:phosphonate metabolism protein (transferase hexapeptide repeat family)
MQQRYNSFPDDASQLQPPLGERPSIHPSAIIIDSTLGAWTEIMRGCQIIESKIGDYSYLAGDNDVIYTDIGKFCSIASCVRMNPGNHPIERVSQHHMTYRRRAFGFGEDDIAFFNWRRSSSVKIGHDVWIGHGAVVMPGTRIGTGAVIGAGAVVTHDVEPYQIVAGVPARPIRYRFPRKIIEKLLYIAWWEWPHELLRQRLLEMNDTERFVETYG